MARTGSITEPFDVFIDQILTKKVSVESDPVKEFVAKMANPDFDKRLEPWEKRFGGENILLRVFEAQQMQQGVLSEFLRVIEIAEP